MQRQCTIYKRHFWSSILHCWISRHKP